MPRLVAVSNRVPSLTNAPTSGGLSVALQAALEERGGVWFGWSGLTAETPETAATLHDLAGFCLATIDLSPDELRGYYEQHANRALWPLLHGRLDMANFEHAAYAVYRKVNRRFARALAPLIRTDDVLWIHDYHLVPLGMELRKLGVRTSIGFFLHTPFPAADTLAAFPWRQEFMEQLAAYDLVGIQSKNSLRNIREATTTQSHGQLKANHYPIGIDTNAFAERAVAPAAQRWVTRFKDFLGGRLWAVGVDRLDYTKGLAERFKAFETLFERTPGLAGRLSLIQIAAPSRESVLEYQTLQTQLERLSGRINGRLGRFDWMPIRYINRTASHDQLAALYRVSRIGVVTPLRDGMNMVAKEFVAAQDPADPGVLVLSRFAGAAEELTEALSVNPYDRVGTAQVLRQAATMPLQERRRRWEPMMDHLRRHDVHSWWRNFLRDLTGRQGAPETVSVVVA